MSFSFTAGKVLEENWNHELGGLGPQYPSMGGGSAANAASGKKSTAPTILISVFRNQ
jgi:hypothetical protein